MSEKEFWRCTPRKLWSLTNVHVKTHDPDGKGSDSNHTGAQTGFIDQVLF